MKNSFEDFLSPFPAKNFSEDFYARKALLIKGDEGKFDKLFSWEKFNNVLNTSGFSDNQIYLSKNNTEEYLPSSGVLPARITTMCNEGYCLNIKNITFFDLELLNFLYDISNQLKSLSRMTLEVSGKNHKTKNFNRTNTELFLLHISGKKKWQIFEPSEKITGNEKPYLEIEANKNDLLYIPSNHYFSSYSEEPSIVILLELINNMGVNFISWVTKKLDIDFSKNLPLQKKNESISNDWKNYNSYLKEQIHEKIKLKSLSEIFYENHIKDLKTLPILNFPDLYQRKY